MNFDFGAPAKLKVDNSGTTAVLNFSQPVTDSPQAIARNLPDYVSAATLSADKRSITLTLNKPHRIRQFVSGSGIGIDLLGTPDNSAVSDTEAKAEPPRLTPEDLAAPAGETLEVAAAPVTAVNETQAVPAPSATPVAKAPAPKPVRATVKADAQVLSTKKPSAEAKPTAKPTAAPKKPPAEPILSTKAAPAAGESTVLTTKAPDTAKAAPEKAPVHTAPASPALSPEQRTTPAAETAPIPVAELATLPAEAAAPDPAPEAAPPEPEPLPQKGPFIVSAKTANGETVLNFPWGTRTAAAVFARGPDIWLVFSQSKDVNVPLIRTILPKQVVNIVQYNMPNNTVLRLITDGSVFAHAEQVKGRYGWNIILSANAAKPALDIPVVADAIDGTTRLVLGVFDTAPPLRFYDPNAGDGLIVVPSFENGRGVAVARNFPELSVLETPQGVAIVNHRSDLTLNSTRTGLILAGKDGLAVSETLPILPGSGPVAGASVNSGVLIPYDQWYVPMEKYRETEILRLGAIANATNAGKADAMFELAKLYLAHGFGTEAAAVLGLIAKQYPHYYADNKLSLLSAAAHVLDDRIAQAAKDLDAPELSTLDEAMLWHEVVALYAAPPSNAQVIQHAVEQQTPTSSTDSAGNPVPVGPPAVAAPAEPTPPATPASRPVFHFLKYNKTYIRFYPPRVRQRLATIAGDAYLADGESEKALAAYDTLVRDDLLGPVRDDAEFALGSAAQKKGEFDQAYEIFDRLAVQPSNPRIAARARFAAAKLRFEQGQLTADAAADILENTRTSWRGDAIEREILATLVDLYTQAKRYDGVLRSYKAILEGFPGDPNVLSISGAMSELFERVFLDGLAEDMQPLKALSLFYEFRDLTPLGEKGDKMIQKLADRLAAIDLLERATQLLENQIKFRSTGEARSQIGARLALLYLLNHKPQEALNVLEVTNYGGNAPDLVTQRQQLTAEALSKLGKNEEALAVITNDTTKTGALLRLDILWALEDWPSVVNHAEDVLNARTNLTEPLSTGETEVLLKLALAYAFESDYVQLRYLRDYYSGLIPDSGYKQIFDYITNDTTPLDPEDFVLLAQQISRTETFLGTFKSKIAQGKLSEAIK